MLAIIICYHSFFEFLPYQLLNLHQFVKCPYRVYIIDNSNKGHASELHFLPFPITYVRSPIINSNPSDRHQQSLNIGLRAAWNDNDSFLFFDNDMIFLNDFHEPDCDLAYTPTFRGKWNYCWLNLMYFKKFQDNPLTFGFYNCPITGENTDSGGNTGLLLLKDNLKKIKITDVLHPVRKENALPTYQINYKNLCDKYRIEPGFDLFDVEGTEIFHFRALSNYLNHPDEFLSAKKKLIIESFWDVTHV